jgi:hypothetical protein
MISNRILQDGDLADIRGPLTFWITDNEDVQTLANCKSIGPDDFKAEVLKAADAFPMLPSEQQEDQKHVTLFIHGYNNTWAEAAGRYQSIVSNLFRGDSSLGLCIMFTWQSAGAALNYLPDREEARQSAPDLSVVFYEF